MLLPTPAASGSPATLRIPQEALVHDGPRSYVWKQTGARQYRRWVLVQAGAGTAATVPILAGVRPGDQVVVTGAYLLQSEFTLRQGATDDHLSGIAV